jgi:Nif-specific regulatory protein
MARLIVIDGPDLGNEYELERSEDGQASQVIVGRDPRAAVPLQDNAVSREHCRVELSSAGCRLVDLGSRNRTFLNGDPVESSWMRDGDVVVIGDSELRFEDDAPPVEMNGIASTIIKALPTAQGGPSRLIGRLAEARDDPNTDQRQLKNALSSMEKALELSAKIAGASSMFELFEQFFDTMAPALDADHGAFLVREGKHWIAKAQSTAERTDPRVHASLTVVERAAVERNAILSSADGKGTAEGQDGNGETSNEHAVAAAVICGDEVAGVVYFNRRERQTPFSEDDLELLRVAAEPVGAVLARLNEQSRLLDENRNLMRSISEARKIIGDSAPIQAVLDFIRRAAPTPMTVLIQGETGTGKDLVASALHYGSPRRGKPFVAINCAALPENLIESELFGHERGSFTGAVARKKGRFELADGGTVFLDELGELTLACQAKLLRLLEERSFERVGGVESIEVDVRIIAATNKDLPAEVEKKTFREDLYYRLGVLTVIVPPLRERTEDIQMLAEHFLALHAEGGRPKKLAASAEKKLMKYGWPGNVRQLRNAIESALVLGEGREIRADDLVLPERSTSASAGSWEPISLQKLEKSHVLRVLEFTKGNKKRAAEILGIERCTLYSKLKNYEV